MKTGDVSFSIWIAAVRCLQKLSATCCLFFVSTRPLEHLCFGVDLLPNWTCMPSEHRFVIFSLLKKKAGAVGVCGLFVNDDACAISFFVCDSALWGSMLSASIYNLITVCTPLDLLAVHPSHLQIFLDEKHTRGKKEKEWEKEIPQKVNMCWQLKSRRSYRDPVPLKVIQAPRGSDLRPRAVKNSKQLWVYLELKVMRTP